LLQTTWNSSQTYRKYGKRPIHYMNGITKTKRMLCYVHYCTWTVSVIKHLNLTDGYMHLKHALNDAWNMHWRLLVYLCNSDIRISQSTLKLFPDIGTFSKCSINNTMFQVSLKGKKHLIQYILYTNICLLSNCVLLQRFKTKTVSI